MSQASLENEFVFHLRRQLKNPKITKSWIQEWCTTKEPVAVALHEGEELVELVAPGLHVWVALKKPEKKVKL